MTPLYPLLFAPAFKQRVWGGRELARWFADLPEGPIGEAWVLSDHPQGRTPVLNGPLRGRTIQSLKAEYGQLLTGSRGVHRRTGEFPLLLKLLHAQDNLSIQVHPGDDYAGLPAGEPGKHEMWVVLHAEPEARLIYGLQKWVTPQALAQAIAEERTMDAMRSLPVRTGDVLDVPPGTVHALGGGLVVAEVQQSSDTTYRLYDYNRTGLDGKPRDLHVDSALAVVRYGTPPDPSHPEPPPANQWQTLVSAPCFQTDRGQCQSQWPQRTPPHSFEVLLLLEGEGRIEWADGREALHPGMAVLVPAALGDYRLSGHCSVLRVRPA